MGNGELVGDEGGVVVEEDVDVERARPPPLVTHAPGQALDALAATQQRERIKVGAHGHDHVQVRPLPLGATDGVGLPDLRLPHRA